MLPIRRQKQTDFLPQPTADPVLKPKSDEVPRHSLGGPAFPAFPAFYLETGTEADQI